MPSPVCKSVLFAAAIAGAANAGVIRHDVDDALYQALGNESRFDAVGTLSITTATGSRICSGTLISDDWILTAAHCFDGAPTQSAVFATDSAFGFVDEIITHPDWVGGGFFGGSDIALLRLRSSIPTITPATIFQGSDELGRTGISVGYGAFGTGLTGDQAGTTGTKRGGENILDVFGSERGWDENILIADFDSPLSVSDSVYGSAEPLGLEYQIAPGDSGGAMFVETPSGVQIAGVTSFIFGADGNPNADYGDLSAYTRVSSFVPWIREVTGVPTPGAGLVLALGGMLAARRKR